MALKWMEGFEHYGFAGDSNFDGFGAREWIQSKWDVGSFNGYPITLGRIAGQAITLTDIDDELAFFETEFLGAENTWIIGFGFKMATNNDGPILELYDENNTPQISIEMFSNKLSVVSNDVILNTGTKSLTTGVWYYIEFKTLIASSGIYTLRINQQLDIFGLGDTDASGSGNASSAVFIAKEGGWDIDDIYVCDGTGSINNDFLGNVRVLSVFPKANGSEQDWTAGRNTPRIWFWNDAGRCHCDSNGFCTINSIRVS